MQFFSNSAKTIVLSTFNFEQIFAFANIHSAFLLFETTAYPHLLFVD